jgi:predicted  nucleic acid-binding Zn-ribbon protein
MRAIPSSREGLRYAVLKEAKSQPVDQPEPCWVCPRCQSINFPDRQACFKCKAEVAKKGGPVVQGAQKRAGSKKPPTSSVQKNGGAWGEVGKGGRAVKQPSTPDATSGPNSSQAEAGKDHPASEKPALWKHRESLKWYQAQITMLEAREEKDLEVIAIYRKKVEELKKLIKETKTPQERLRSALDKVKQAETQLASSETELNEQQERLDALAKEVQDKRAALAEANQEREGAAKDVENEEIQKKFPEAKGHAEGLVAKFQEQIQNDPEFLEKVSQLMASMSLNSSQRREAQATHSQGEEGRVPKDAKEDNDDKMGAANGPDSGEVPGPEKRASQEVTKPGEGPSGKKAKAEAPAAKEGQGGAAASQSGSS